NGDNCGNSATLVLTSGTLTSSGTITADVVNGGYRVIQGNVTNTGTINVNQTVYYNAAATLTNQGAVNVADAKALIVSSGAAFTNGSGGSISTAGNGNVDVEVSTFNEGAGTTSGSAPVFVDDGTQNHTRSG